MPFFNDTATTEIYTLSLHALPIYHCRHLGRGRVGDVDEVRGVEANGEQRCGLRSEDHTAELQPLASLVCLFLMIRRPPRSTLFPYTLFRSITAATSAAVAWAMSTKSAVWKRTATSDAASSTVTSMPELSTSANGSTLAATIWAGSCVVACGLSSTRTLSELPQVPGSSRPSI